MSLFRKPKRNVRQRQVDDDDDEVTNTQDDEDPSLEEVKSTIAKFKEKKSSKDKKKSIKSEVVEIEKDKKVPSQLLSFDEDLTAAGEHFTLPYTHIKTSEWSSESNSAHNLLSGLARTGANCQPSII